MNTKYIETLMEVKEVDDDRTLEFVASKEVVDRDGDLVLIDGLDVKAFKKNPVILWAHDHKGLPIGKAIKVFKRAGELVMKIKFAEPEVNGFADTVYRLAKAGYIKAVSLGFIPDWNSVEYPEKEKKIKGKIVRRIIKMAEVIECSLVPCPANQEALATGKSIEDAVEREIIDEAEYKEFLLMNKPQEDEEDLELKSEQEELLEKNRILQAKVAELELKLNFSELEGDESEYKDLWDEFVGPLSRPADEHIDEHTDDTISIDNLINLLENE